MKIVISTDRNQPNDRYRGALLCCGALPEEVVVVTPGEKLPASFDGLLIAGGSDVDPSRYGEARATPTLQVRADRDDLDFTLFNRAEQLSVPVFGICRGLQVVNVALGGTLWQDLPSQRDRGLSHETDRADFPPSHLAHTVRPAPNASTSSIPEDSLGALFAKVGELEVNSRHHQAVKDLAHSLVPLTASPDDLVEAFERKTGPFLGAVQWHPEDLVRQPFHKALFKTFLEACRRHTTEAVPPIEVSLEGSIPVVRINRPARRNAFAGTMREMLSGTIDALSGDPSVPAIVLTGAGGSFSAGGDLEVLAALLDAEDVEGFRQLLLAGSRAVLSIVGAPRPVIAAIDGAAVGAGMNLALACDVRVASAHHEHPAFFAQSFAAIGLAPDWGGTYHLPRIVGPGAAADLVFSAEKIPLQRARELGLVDYVAEENPALPLAMARASLYAERPIAALAAAKKALNADAMVQLKDALARETEIQIELFRSGDVRKRLGSMRKGRADA